MRHEDTDRTIELSAVVDGSPEEVWRAWTTREGITSWLVSDARVELEIGGPFELYFGKEAPAGQRGSEECTILTYVPERILSFTWNAPPTIPELRKLGPCTWVVLEFEENGRGRTQIRFRQLGIKRGEAWDRYLEYFQEAWARVLAACEKHFASREQQAPRLTRDS